MAHHHAHEDGHRKGHPHEHGQAHSEPRKGMHMGWWAAIGLVAMIAALAVYALTVDESIIPGLGKPKAQVPAAP